MRFNLFSPLLFTALSISPALGQLNVHLESFPEVPSNAELIGYSFGDEIPIECIQRNMETGEHKFDEQGNIIYAPFPKCFETDAPLSLRYGVDESVNCSIDLGHEFFHIFQLYIHEDVPFSCRIPYAKSIVPHAGAEADVKTIYTSLTLNIRGIVQESHLDIDPVLNVAMLSNVSYGTISSSIGFSSGNKVQRFIIGDPLPLFMSIKWYKSPFLPSASSAYFAGHAIFFYSLASSIATAAVCAAIFYGHYFPKKLKQELKRSVPVGGGLGNYSKLD